MDIVLDIETDSLDATKVWCVVAKEVGSKSHKVWDNETLHDGSLKKFLDGVDRIIGHNIISFDVPVLNRLLLGDDSKYLKELWSKCLDTLIISRMTNYRLMGGHSLEAWGRRLKFPKLDFKEFERYSEEMLTYCKTDVDLTEEVYLFLSKRYVLSEQGKKSLDVEHKMSALFEDMKQKGFPFDIGSCMQLYAELTDRLSNLDGQIKSVFKVKPKLVKVFTPKKCRDGSISKVGFKFLSNIEDRVNFLGGPVSVIDWVEFNPGSHKQIVEAMNKFGWKPVNRTKTYMDYKRQRNYKKLEELKDTAWKVDEENLSTLPPEAPAEAKMLVTRSMVANRLSTLQQWIDAYSEETKSIHGTVTSIGTKTHRSAHSKPNIGNVTASHNEYGMEMRAMWDVSVLEEDYGETWLVGTDASGVQLRALAHYLKYYTNDSGVDNYIESIVNGTKENETDVHNVNKKILGPICRTRDDAKTFIYAFLFGATASRTATILGCSRPEGGNALRTFVERVPGLLDLRDLCIPKIYSKGYARGLDDRAIKLDYERLVLSVLCQSFEAILMKHATISWASKVVGKFGEKVRLGNLIHDEWQTIVHGSRDMAEEVGRLQVKAIEDTANELGSLCPCTGEYKIGKHWAQTH